MSVSLPILGRLKMQAFRIGELVATNFKEYFSPRVTVVISTYNRAKSLERTLEAVRKQTYRKFEVLVVNGPSIDNTDVLLERNARHIKVAVCPETNIGLSRNIGVEMAAGDIIAFVDDDAVPSHDWLDKLVSAYRDPLVMAAGGYVVHKDGLVWGPCTCSRLGDPLVAADPPASRYAGKRANPFLYLAGCNMSFRRAALIEMGGFNENLTYPYEDVEICRRLIDAGRLIAFLEDAVVHHYPEANGVRDKAGVIRDGYQLARAQAIFALQDDLDEATTEDVISHLNCAANWRALAEKYFEQGVFGAEERDIFIGRVDQGVAVGIAVGLEDRPIRSFALSASPFKRFS